MLFYPSAPPFFLFLLQPFSLSRDSPNFSSTSRAPRPEPNHPSAPLYVVVFGYPPDKYSITVDYFKSLGSATDPEPNTEIVNCFRIGYRDPGDAMRAVRKNGEVLSGTYMIGVKWAVSFALSWIMVVEFLLPISRTLQQISCPRQGHLNSQSLQCPPPCRNLMPWL